MPKVSVIMPVFNGERYIRDAIASVLAQEKTDLELIVVNDGSTDNTTHILEALAINDPRLCVITRQNSGRPSFPKNDGLAVARGEYVCFLDHDDLYDADRTWQLVEGLENHPEWVAAFHDLRFFDNEGQHFPETYLSGPDFMGLARPYLAPLDGDWFECGKSFYVYQSLRMGALHTQSVLIAKKRLPTDTVHFDTQFTICDDTDLWMRLGLLGKIGFLNRVLSSYRQHESSITRNREKLLLDWLKLHQLSYQRVGNKLAATQLQQYRRKISLGFADLAYLRYEQYRLKDARDAYSQAISWSLGQEVVIGYLKTFIPAGMLRGMRSVVAN